MKRPYRFTRATLIGAAVFALASLGIYAAQHAWRLTSSVLLPLTVTVQPKEFTLKIPASGELQSTESTTIAVPPVPVFRLRVGSVVTDGRHVNKGDVLVEFDPVELNLQALEHRSNLAMADQKISRGGLAVDVEKADIIKDKRIAQLELEKINEFLPRDQTLYSRRELIEGELDKDYTERKIVYAEARLELKGKVYSLDEAILMLERQQATSKISQVEKALASLQLLSPASGVVVYNDPGFYFGNPRLMPGRVVWVGMTLLNLVNPDKMEAKCFVLEKDAGELRPQQPVTLTLDPFPGVQFTGKVKSIDKMARALDRGSPVKYFQTTVSLDKTDPELMRPGIKLKAQILAGALKSVIVVPRSALVKRDAGFVAYVETGPFKFEPVPVTLGQGDLIQVVVTEGLRSGQRLALNPPDLPTPGSEARASRSKAVGP